ncbi:MAG: ribbon-helix-helix domain-containing protein [Chitinivibrionia bacterium]|jgi:metal-responsive CopG/Arc/MetJ family transcriptional regulator|nr:ribbon-helix-helix domain-containing protein [Chitinivibrionia bacterium]
MPVSNVKVSFKKDFLDKIDQIAEYEARTRSELIREAVRLYVNRKNEFNGLFKIGKQIGSTLSISENDIMNEIKSMRKNRSLN